MHDCTNLQQDTGVFRCRWQSLRHCCRLVGEVRLHPAHAPPPPRPSLMMSDLGWPPTLHRQTQYYIRPVRNTQTFLWYSGDIRILRDSLARSNLSTTLHKVLPLNIKYSSSSNKPVWSGEIPLSGSVTRLCSFVNDHVM